MERATRTGPLLTAAGRAGLLAALEMGPSTFATCLGRRHHNRILYPLVLGGDPDQPVHGAGVSNPGTCRCRLVSGLVPESSCTGKFKDHSNAVLSCAGRFNPTVHSTALSGMPHRS